MPRRSKTGEVPDWDGLYAIAEVQAGYLLARQAAAFRFSRQVLEYQARAGALDRTGIRGIYRLKRFPAQPNEDLAVLWLWAAKTGAFSHRTALALHGLEGGFTALADLTVPVAWSKRRLKVPGGLRLHFAEVPEADTAWVAPVRVTSVLRTLVDCAAILTPEELEKSVLSARSRGLITGGEIRAALPGVFERLVKGR